MITKEIKILKSRIYRSSLFSHSKCHWNIRQDTCTRRGTQLHLFLQALWFSLSRVTLVPTLAWPDDVIIKHPVIPTAVNGAKLALPSLQHLKDRAGIRARQAADAGRLARAFPAPWAETCSSSEHIHSGNNRDTIWFCDNSIIMLWSFSGRLHLTRVGAWSGHCR